jgi:hypothetical protein
VSAALKRVFIFDFIRSPDAPSRAVALLRQGGVAICGWEARPQSEASVPRAFWETGDPQIAVLQLILRELGNTPKALHDEGVASRS